MNPTTKSFQKPTFAEMPLPEELQMGLKALKFSKPTEVQAAVIPYAIQNQDIITSSETGSGKTAAYGIPMVMRLLATPGSQALVLAPTRELVHQISDFLRELTRHTEDLRVTSIVGGAEMRKQLKALKRKPRIIVATPGRLIDHLKRGSLKLATTHCLVLDEGDRMLDMGFAPQLDDILKFLPKKRQTSLFTATLPAKVQKLANKYLHQPKKIQIGTASRPVSSIRQSVVQVEFKQKDDRVMDELNSRQGSVIIFLRTQHRTDFLAKKLREFGYKIDLIHGGRTQGQRNKAILNFRQGKSRILCATDIAARGLDVPEVEHVINYDLPMMSEDYVHRIGRTARNGAKGEAVSFVTPEERREWQSLVKKYKILGADVDVPRGDSKRFSRKRRTHGAKTQAKKTGGQFKRRPSFKKKTSGKSKFKSGRR